MQLFAFAKSSSTTVKLSITTEDIRNYKDLLHGIQGQKMNATAMHLITNETIYKVAVDVAARAMSLLKKVIRRGQCHYKVGSRTDRLVTSFKKVLHEYKEMSIKMQMKMFPTKADYLIECWLKKDAAEKAAQEYRDRRAIKKAAKKAAATATGVTVVVEPANQTFLDSFLKNPTPEPMPDVIISREVIV